MFVDGRTGVVDDWDGEGGEVRDGGQQNDQEQVQQDLLQVSIARVTERISVPPVRLIY